MITVTNTLTTQEASRIIKRLCKHWAHKLDVEYDDTQGRVKFSESNICLLQAQENKLLIELTVDNEESQQQLAQVVIDHVKRMAKEPIVEAEWQTKMA